MIICSAVMFHEFGYGYPIILTGKHHSDCFKKAFEMHLSYDKQKCIQGFLTDTFQFLDRYNAKPEARKCGQLLHDNDSRELFSEDIWTD